MPNDCHTECPPLDEEVSALSLTVTSGGGESEDCIQGLTKDESLGDPTIPVTYEDSGDTVSQLTDGSAGSELTVGNSNNNSPQSVSNVLSNPAGKLTVFSPTFQRGDLRTIVDQQSGLTGKSGPLPAILLPDSIPDYDSPVFNYNGSLHPFSSSEVSVIGAKRINEYCNGGVESCNMDLRRIHVTDTSFPYEALFSFSSEGENAPQFTNGESYVQYEDRMFLPKLLHRHESGQSNFNYGGVRYVPSLGKYVYFTFLITDVGGGMSNGKMWIVTSTDLKNWTQGSLVYEVTASSSNGIFIGTSFREFWRMDVRGWACGGNTIVLPTWAGHLTSVPPSFIYSTDGGVTWNNNTADSTIRFATVCYCEALGRFVAFGYYGSDRWFCFFYSSNGTSWTIGDGWQVDIFNNNASVFAHSAQITWSEFENRFVAIVFKGSDIGTRYLFSSTDGISWTLFSEVASSRPPSSKLHANKNGFYFSESHYAGDAVNNAAITIRKLVGSTITFTSFNSFVNRFPASSIPFSQIFPIVQFFNHLNDGRMCFMGFIYTSDILYNANFGYEDIDGTIRPIRNIDVNRYQVGPTRQAYLGPRLLATGDDQNTFLDPETGDIYVIEKKIGMKGMGYTGISPEVCGTFVGTSAEDLGNGVRMDGYGYAMYLVSDTQTPKGRRALSLRTQNTNLSSLAQTTEMRNEDSSYFGSSGLSLDNELIDFSIGNGISFFSVYKVVDATQTFNYPIIAISGERYIGRNNLGYYYMNGSIPVLVGDLDLSNGWNIDSIHVERVTSGTWRIKTRNNFKPVDNVVVTASLFSTSFGNGRQIKIEADTIASTAGLLLRRPQIEFCHLAALTYVHNDEDIIAIESKLKNFYF